MFRSCFEGSALAFAYGNLWGLEHFRIKIIKYCILVHVLGNCTCIRNGTREYGNGTREYGNGARAYGARAVKLQVERPFVL